MTSLVPYDLPTESNRWAEKMSVAFLDLPSICCVNTA